MTQSKQELINELSQLKKEVSKLKRAIKKTENTINTSEISYYDLYENSPNMLCSIEAKTGKMIRCNKAMARFLGYSKSELIGRPVIELYFPESRDNAKMVFLQFVKHGSVKDAELQIMRKDGSKIDICLNVSSLKNKKGEILYSRSSLHDISKTKLTEKLLKESEKKYRDVFESAYDVIFMLNKKGDILDINHRGEKLTGYKKKRLREMNVLKHLIIQEDRPNIRQVIDDVAKGKERVYKVSWKTKSGKTIHFDGTTTSRFSEEGKFISTRCVLRDITQHRKAEQQLRESEERYRTLVNTIQEGLIMVDNAGIIQYVNKPFCKMLGYRENEIIGQNANKVKWLNREQQAIIIEKRKLRKKGVPDTYNLEFTNKKGEKRCILISGAPVYVTGSFAVNTDITNIKETEEELKKRYEQLKKYAFITSHELRRPVSSILGLIPLIQAIKPDKPINKDMLTMLQFAVEDLDKVTRETNEILTKDKLIEPMD